jgi:hypothetical protein
MKIGFLDLLGVVQGEVLKTDVGQLLDDVGPSAAEPEDGDTRAVEMVLQIRTEESLPV